VIVNFKKILFTILLSAPAVFAGNGVMKHPRTVSRIYPVQRSVAAYRGVILVKRQVSLSKGSVLWQETLRKIDAIQVSREFPMHPSGSPLSSIYRIEIPLSSDVYAAAEQCLDDPQVAWAEPVYLRRLHYQVNDPQAISQWHLDSLHCAQAWDLSRGDASIVIGIVDTGVELTHPDLQANIWTNPHEIANDGIDNDNNGYIDDVHGWDFGNDDPDPNPSSNATASERWHGTTVAGTASAVTDNGVGIAAPAFNAKIMAVKVARDDDADQNIIDGYRGMVYAVDQGADIINCSFGGAGASNAEREVIEYASGQGVVVVASSGNSGDSTPEYPATYPSVLSVGSVDYSGYRSHFSNYGPEIDVSAYGENIYTCTINRGYRSVSGTSYSSPLTAGVLALVKAFHPEWTAEQVREQVRVSALPIDQMNPRFEGLLGFGRVDAFSALTVTSPAIRLVHLQITEGADSNQDGVLAPGETAEIVFTLKNYLAPSGPVSIHLSTDQSVVTLENPDFTFSGLATFDSLTNPDRPLPLQIDSQAKRGTEVIIQLHIQSGSYSDQEQFTIEIAPDYKSFAGSHVVLTLTSAGSLGFADYPDNTRGAGFLYGIENLLFEGAFLAAVSSDSVSDTARGANQDKSNHDFEATPDGFVQMRNPPQLGDVEGVAKFSDAQAINGMGLEVETRLFAFNQAPDENYVLLAYQLKASKSLNDCYAGLFMDWDVGDEGLNASSNRHGYDTALNMAYIYDPATNLYGGLQIFPGSYAVNYRSIFNPDDIYDGFTDWEKWDYLTHGIQTDTLTIPEDYSHLLGAGPIKIGAQDTAYLGFAVLAGEGLENLKASARAARIQWQNYASLIAIPVPAEPPDTAFALYPARPNPFSGETTLLFEIPESGHVRISVYDMLGRFVTGLYDDNLAVSTSSHDPASVIWNGTTRTGSKAASGLYFICLEYLSYRIVRKVILLQGAS
jgi:serine protease